MSNTPRTDAAAERGSDCGLGNEMMSGIWPLARQLEAENAELREALAPFVTLLQEHHDHMPDSQPLFGVNDAIIYIGQLRRARALLAKLDGK